MIGRWGRRRRRLRRGFERGGGGKGGCLSDLMYIRIDGLDKCGRCMDGEMI